MRHRCGGTACLRYVYVITNSPFTCDTTPSSSILVAAVSHDVSTMNETRPFAYPTHFPFYHTDMPSIIPNISDTITALAAPILTYWVFSLFFHALDMSGWKWLEKYRLHDSAEVKSKNLATRSQVIWAVIFQQVIQTALVFVGVAEQKYVTSQARIDAMHRIGGVVINVARTVLGKSLGTKFIHAMGADTVYFVYWWAIPTAQFFSAMYALFYHLDFSTS